MNKSIVPAFLISAAIIIASIFIFMGLNSLSERGRYEFHNQLGIILDTKTGEVRGVTPEEVK